MCCFFATSALALCPKAVLLWVFSLGLCFPPPTTLHCCLRTPLLRNLHLYSSTALPHYKQVPAFSVHTSEQTVHASQNGVCPVLWTHKKERKCRRTQALKRMSSAVAQERAYPTDPPERMPWAARLHHRQRTLQLDIVPPGTTGPETAVNLEKPPNFLFILKNN